MAGVRKGSSLAERATLGFGVVYFLTDALPSTPFPVKDGEAGGGGGKSEHKSSNRSGSAKSPGSQENPDQHVHHLLAPAAAILTVFPPSHKSFKNTSGREEGRANRVTGREKGSAWPSSEADPESPGRRPPRCTAPAPTSVPSLQGRGERTHNPARARGTAKGRATLAKERRSGRHRSPPEEPPVSLRAAAFHIPPLPFHEQGGRGSSTKL